MYVICLRAIGAEMRAYLSRQQSVNLPAGKDWRPCLPASLSHDLSPEFVSFWGKKKGRPRLGHPLQPSREPLAVLTNGYRWSIAPLTGDDQAQLDRAHASQFCWYGDDDLIKPRQPAIRAGKFNR